MTFHSFNHSIHLILFIRQFLYTNDMALEEPDMKIQTGLSFMDWAVLRRRWMHYLQKLSEHSFADLKPNRPPALAAALSMALTCKRKLVF